MTFLDLCDYLLTVAPSRTFGAHAITLEETSMTKTFAMTVRWVSAIVIGLAFAVSFSAVPAKAAVTHYGVSSTCTVVNPNRFQCNFSVFSATATVQILYASMQCGSTGSVNFDLQEFQVLATPPNSSSEVAYQIPLENQPALGGVVNAGSPVTIFAGANTTTRALIDVTPAPTSGTTQCTVSLSAEQL
jgi:hypothetical protein